MFYVQWPYVWELSLVATTLLVHRYVYRPDPRLWWRAVLMILLIPLGGLSGVVLCVQLLPVGCATEAHSEPIYSPDRSEVARVETMDGGALGGSSAVVVYRFHGFSSAVVFTGFWGEVTPDSVRWTGEQSLEIRYDDPYQATCSTASWLDIDCQYRDPHDRRVPGVTSQPSR